MKMYYAILSIQREKSFSHKKNTYKPILILSNRLNINLLNDFIFKIISYKKRNRTMVC